MKDGNFSDHRLSRGNALLASGFGSAARSVRGARLERSLAVLAHETAHAFGLEHCTAYQCVMNGSNSLEELDQQFGELCPICLRKLAWNIGFDPVERYVALRDFYRKQGLSSLGGWMDRRLSQVSVAAPHRQSPPESPP
jgi:archaemetzincin